MRLLDPIMRHLGYVAKARTTVPADYDVGPSRTNTPQYQQYDPNIRGGGVPFTALRSFAQACDPVKLCINRVRTMLLSVDWAVNPVDPENPNEAQLASARAWCSEDGGLGRPGTTFDEFMGEMVEDLLVCGAVALYKRPTVATARGMSTNLTSIEPVDAATIIPKRDSKGWIPEPPAVAFEQVLRTGGKTSFTANQFIYRTWLPRTYASYGQSLVENVMMAVLQFQAADLYNLLWFTEGDNVQGVWKYTPAVAGGEAVSDQEIATFRKWLDTQHLKAARKGKPLNLTPPAGWTYIPFRLRSEADYIATQRFLVQRIAPHFGLTPSSLGLESDTYKASQEAQLEASLRQALKPLTRFFERILTEILQADLGLTEVQFKFDTEVTDKEQVAGIVATAGSRYVTVNEGREWLGLPKVAGPLADDLYEMTAGGPVLLASTEADRADKLGVTTNAENGNDAVSNENDAAGAGVTVGKKLDQAARADIRRWREKVAKAVKQGRQPGQVAFVSDHIPGAVSDEIAKGLQAGDYRAAFAPWLSGNDRPAQLVQSLSSLVQALETEAEQRGVSFHEL